ncbi:MAG: hypothetical protein JWP89_5023 [Schlesneria sp.]|nr:hypothetical protein [Schlesneria sp.]
MLTSPFRSTYFLGIVIAILLSAGSNSVELHAQDFEREPINYATATPDNPISRLRTRLDEGTSQLSFAEGPGYLKSLLAELKIPVSSQTLVFSKTSLQRHRITPRTPRAIYFNDDTYVGFCQNGDVLELSVADPQLGAVFYTLDQDATLKPHLARQVDNCLLCHGTGHTRGVPGHFIRSVYTDSVGFPVLAMGTHRIDHSSPISHRWGGWYVTGTHGEQEHRGNLIVSGKQEREPVDNAAGQNVTDLTSRFKTSAYLSPHSDLIALMVLEHQTEAHNLLTRASFQAREALYSEAKLNKELGEQEGHRWDSTNTRIKSSCEALVKYMLFCDEAPLTSPLQGTSTFAADFVELGPRDPANRSLRDFDLQRRLFKYPCSYLIYSRSFDELPAEAKSLAYRRLWEVLSGADQTKTFAHLTEADRQAIREILIATKPGLPDYWQNEQR